MYNSKRCSPCGINLPRNFYPCPVCGEPTWDSKVPPDEDWEESVAWGLHKREELNHNPMAIYEHPPDGRCDVLTIADRFFLRHADLLNLGYRHLETDKVVFVNDRFFELAGFSQTTGYWLVDEVVTEGAADDLHPSMFEVTGGAGGKE